MSEDELSEFDVAVVVFCRARGVDESDAESGAQLAVRNAIAGGQRVAKVPMSIPLPPHLVERGFTDPVLVADVTGLRYVGGQGIRLVATAEPYQNAGMGKPRKVEEHAEVTVPLTALRELAKDATLVASGFDDLIPHDTHYQSKIANLIGALGVEGL